MRMPYGVCALTMDVMAALKDRRAKAESKVTRTVKVLESARKELADLIAAERVMAEITGESIEVKAAGTPVSDRDHEMAKLLKADPLEASSPVDLHPMYVKATGDNINLDAFRTALWRLQKKIIRDVEGCWAIRSEGGRYWREPASDAEDFEDLLG